MAVPFCVERMKKADPFYQSSRWVKKREKIMRRDGYMCQYFKRLGKMRPADTVHHIFPRELFPEYAWEDWNLIALSNEAHNKMHHRDSHDLTAAGQELMWRTARKHGIAVPPTSGDSESLHS